MMYDNRSENRAVGYEYKNITVARSMESVYTDGYANFGWQFTGTQPALQGGIAVVLKFKRNRQLKNRSELNRLEREFENGLHEIEKLERRKNASVTGSAIGFGILGTCFLAGAVLSFIAGNIALGVLLLVPALAGWTLGYVGSVRIGARKAEQAAPQIDGYYDAVCQICEKANTLIPE